MSDQTIQYDEEMVGAGHPTKADTLNRLALVETDADGRGKMRFLKEQASAPTPGDNEGVLYTADDGGDTCLYYKAGMEVLKLAQPGHPFMTGYDGTAENYGGDLDSLVSGGFYYANTSASNKPATTNGYAFVIGYSSTYAAQTYIEYNGGTYTRTLQAGSWTSWEKIITDADAGLIGLSGQGEAETDNANNCIYNGFYALNAAAANNPKSAAGYLLVHRYNTNYILQIYRPLTQTGTFYIRHYTVSAWSSWTEMYTADAYSSSYGTSGYFVMPTGLVVQWGIVSYTPTATKETKVISFPMAFPTGCRAVTALTNGYPDSKGVGVSSFSATSWTATVFSDPIGSTTIRYFAVGY